MGKQRILQGAIILTASNFITRLLGFAYRITMANAIGAEGPGLYQLFMPLYSLAWCITSAGLTTTLSHLTARHAGQGHPENARRLLHLTFGISFVLSLPVSLVLFFGAPSFVNHLLGDCRVLPALRILSFCVPAMAMGSCIRGYFYGCQIHRVPALSQLLEQVLRLSCLLVVAHFFSLQNETFAVSAAALSVVLGEVGSCLFVFLCLRQDKPSSHPATLSYPAALSALLAMAVPLGANRILSSLFNTAESLMIPQRLSLFPGSENALADFGRLTGMAMPLLQLPSSFLTALSTALLPAVSHAAAQKRSAALQAATGQSILFTLLSSYAAAGVLFLFGDRFCALIYHDASLSQFLKPLAFYAPLLYVHITLSGLLNGLALQRFSFLLHTVSSCCTLVLLYIGLPQIGLAAYFGAMGLSLVLTVSLSAFRLKKEGVLHLSPIHTFFYPALAFVLAVLVNRLLQPSLSQNLLGTGISCLVFVLCYGLVLLWTGSIALCLTGKASRPNLFARLARQNQIDFSLDNSNSTKFS